MTKGYFVTGIGTDVGKTVISAMLVSALKADYWKPVQAGDLASTDSHKVAALCSGFHTPKIHPEQYRLSQPMSPHAAASLDGIAIEHAKLILPHSQNLIIVEGAGGLMVPLHDSFLVIDLIQKLSLPVIVVSRNYLGSINHTLLTLEALRARSITVAGLVFNGPAAPTSEQFITEYSRVKILGHVPEVEAVTPQFVATHGAAIKERL